MDDAELLEFTGTDVRYVAVIWRNGTGEDEGAPFVELGGCTEFEAVGLLRAALYCLERDNADTISLECEDGEEEYEDDEEDD